MTVEELRSLERIHAAAAWISAAGLGAVAWALARGREARRIAIGAAAAIAGLLVAGATGLALHDPYRAKLRQRLFLDAPALGWLFERKQHLAFGALALGVGAAATLEALRRIEARPADAALARDLRRSAALAWIAAAALSLAAAIASAIVARRASF